MSEQPMNEGSQEFLRRDILKATAAIALGQLCVAAPAGVAGAAAATHPAAPVGKPQGRAGDFNFLAGEWRISHRKRKATGKDAWDEFSGEATCWTILGGVGSVEELRIPARGFAGMGLRLLDVQQLTWTDFWVNAKSGVLTTPGQTGVFENGVGTFVADDVDGDTPIKVRGVWDRITARSCRWHQAISRDGGKSWQEDWLMDWVRV